MKLSIHPLFFIFGLYFALTGKVFLFLTYTLTALIHEYGHAIAAEKLGYKMNKIVLMPYGAVVNGAIGGLSYKDEVIVALSGPFTNICLCVLFVALWWLFPETYPYTDVVFLSNLSIAAINLLPAFPLDGGRIISAALSLKFPQKKVITAMKISGIIISAGLFALFLFSIFNKINLSLLFFALFILIGALKKADQSAYVKMYMRKSALSGGVKECKRYVVNGKTTLKTLMSKLNDGYIYTLEIADENGKDLSLNYEKTQKLLSSYRYYDKLSDIAKDM